MPLLVHVVSAWIAGLFLSALAHESGEAAHIPVAIVACGVTALIALMRYWPRRAAFGSRPVAVAIATCAGIAIAIGHAHWQQRSACLMAMDHAAREAARDGKGVPFDIIIDEHLGAGKYSAGVARGRGTLSRCALHASIRIRAGEARAGETIVVAGTALATDRGFRIDGTIESHSGRRDPLRAMRARAGTIIDTLFPARAALVRALLIADQDGIDHRVRDVYAEAGLVHMLSISGLHVAIIAEALLILTTAMRLSRTAASVSSLVVIAGYVLMLGAPAPAVRSAMMLATVSLSDRMQRPVHPWTALALGAWLPTIDAAVVINLGWQLSVGGMAALVAAREILRRVRQYERRPDIPRALDSGIRYLKRQTGWRKLLVREVITGTIATLVTAPIIAWSFGRVSIVAPLSNIVAGPIVGFVQPALFLALLLAPLEPLARIVADASTLPLLVLDKVAAASARVPFAALRIAPGMAGAVCAGMASLLFVRGTASRRLTPWLAGAACFTAIGAWAPLAMRGSGRMELHMIDVDQGDAVALRTPRGRWILFDAGRSWKGGDAGQRQVVPYLRMRGGNVAAFVLSHAHDDHVGGAPSVIEALQPARWIEPAYITTTPMYVKALAALREHHIPWKRVHPGDSLTIDGIVLRVLGPDSAWTAHQTNPNEASVVVMAEHRGAKFLFTGDAELHEEAWLVERWGTALDADVLKLGHHGSRTSSSAPFVDMVTPLLALASVGAANRYGHPSPETLQSMYARGVPVLRTDREGSIVVESDGRRLDIRTRRDRWAIPLR